MIETELTDDYTVINFGMYGGLGSTVMLDLAEPYIRQGDIIIFSPEQTAQTLSMYFDSEAMWQAVDGDFSLLSKLSRDNLTEMIGQFPYFAVKKYKDFTSENMLVKQGVYSRESFNQYGDIVYDSRAQNVMSGGYDINTPISFKQNIITSEFINYVNDFAKKSESRGATMYYRFCPMNAQAISVWDENEIYDYYAFLQQQWNLRLLVLLSRQ